MNGWVYRGSANVLEKNIRNQLIETIDTIFLMCSDFERTTYSMQIFAKDHQKWLLHDDSV